MGSCLKRNSWWNQYSSTFVRSSHAVQQTQHPFSLNYDRLELLLLKYSQHRKCNSLNQIDTDEKHVMLNDEILRWSRSFSSCPNYFCCKYFNVFHIKWFARGKKKQHQLKRKSNSLFVKRIMTLKNGRWLLSTWCSIQEVKYSKCLTSLRWRNENKNEKRKKPPSMYIVYMCIFQWKYNLIIQINKWIDA